MDNTAFRPAPHGRRVIAWLIDYLMVMLLFSTIPQPVSYFLFLLVFVAYHTLFIWTAQQTIGKALLGLEVERIGGKPTLLWALGRTCVGYFAVDVLGVGTMTALFNRSHRCLHDYVFDSVVAFPGADAKTKALLSRLVRLAERQKAALDKKTKTATILLLFWKSLTRLCEVLARAIDRVASVAPAGPTTSVAGALSLKAAAGIAVAATLVSAAAATAMPRVRYAAEWWIAPRYFLSDPPPGWGRCSCPIQHPGAGALYFRNGTFERWHEGGLSCPG